MRSVLGRWCSVRLGSSRLTEGTVLCPLPSYFILCLVLAKPSKTGECSEMIEKLLTGTKNINTIILPH